MIRHVVLFTWTPEATSEQKRRAQTETAALPGLIAEIRSFHLGPDAGIVSAGNADFALTADFDDASGYLAYRNHPAHQRLISESINPILAQRVSAQFEF